LQHENRLVPYPPHSRSYARRRTCPNGRGWGNVEIDETFIGRKDGFEMKQGPFYKNAVLTLVDAKALPVPSMLKALGKLACFQ